MTTFGDIVRTCAEEGINFTEIDHILVSEETIDDFRQKMQTTENISDANYRTTGTPAVRATSGDEKLVYVDEYGRKQEVLL